VLLDERKSGRSDYPSLAVRMCNRHFGVGGDGLLLISQSKSEMARPATGADFRFRMFNPDGTEDGCGNGLRCAIKYWLENVLPRPKDGKTQLLVEQRSGISPAIAVMKEGVMRRVTVSMGLPTFEPSGIPIASDHELVDAPVRIGGKSKMARFAQKFRITCISTGSAHTVIFVPRSPLTEAIPRISATIERHPLFPERTNVLWTYVRSRSRLEVGVWERGAGETLGCGTGACAAAVVAARLGLANRKVTIMSKGGEMEVEWAESGAVLLTGDAVEVFRGTWVEGRGTGDKGRH
jgi:diaminopimelate epimerase